MSEEFMNSKPFLCGVIEGFYGRPWTPLQRKELFSRMKDMGMNCYLYAPKDDAKHRQLWREMYTVEESEEMQALINAAKECKVEFVYAISPGLDIAFSSDKDVKTLKRKLEHMRQMGCTSFALLFDDIEPQLSAVDRDVFLSYGHAQISLTNDIYQYLGSPECFMFCPTEYCATRAVPDVTKSSYLNLIGSKLFQGIDIMWTGSKVIPKDITLESIEELSRVLHRAPLIWDNLHANDYDQKRLFLGPYQGRSTKLIPYLRGVMSNPNCEFEANYVAMHTLAQWSKCCAEVSNPALNGPSCARPVAVELSTDNNTESPSESVSVVAAGIVGNSLLGDMNTNHIYNPRRALLVALQDWLSIMQRSADAKTTKKRHTTRVRYRKSVAKALLAAAKGSFPPAAAQELERVSQSAITLAPNSTAAFSVCSSPNSNNSSDYSNYLVSPAIVTPLLSTNSVEYTSALPSAVTSLDCLPQMEYSQPPIDQVVQVSQPNAELIKDDPEMARSALLAAAVVVQVAVDEANINAMQQNLTPLALNIAMNGNSDKLDGKPNNLLASGASSSSSSYMIPALTGLDSTFSVASQQAADILEQSNEAQLLQLQNDTNLFPAPLSAPPPVFTTATTPSDNGPITCPTSGGNNIVSTISPTPPTSVNINACSQETSNTTTAVVLLQPTSTLFTPVSSYDTAVEMPMETEEIEMMECQHSYELLQQQQKYLENSSTNHSPTYSPKPPPSPSTSSVQKQMLSGLSSIEVLNDLENIDDDSCSQESSPPFAMEDLCLLVDIFYLPYEFGPKAQYLLELLHWLRLNAHYVSIGNGNCPLFDSMNVNHTEEVDPNKMRQEWFQRATEFRRLVDAVCVLCERLNNLPNRALLFDLYPYIWDVRTLLSMLDTYITWLGRYPLNSNSFMILRRLLTWGTPGYKQTFMGGEHEPWMFRGGFTTELQRMLPLEGAVDLFPSRLPPPVMPPHSDQAPNSSEQSSSSNQSEITPLIYVMQVRPYQNELDKDRETVYNLCRRITWLRAHLDYAQLLGTGVNLAVNEDCFVKRGLVDLPGDRYLLGFLRLSPQYCFVVEDAQGEVCGFAFATDNAKTYYENLDKKLLPSLRNKYPIQSDTSNSMHVDEDMDSDGMDTTPHVVHSSNVLTGQVDEDTHISNTIQSLKQWFYHRDVYPLNNCASSTSANTANATTASAAAHSDCNQNMPSSSSAATNDSIATAATVVATNTITGGDAPVASNMSANILERNFPALIHVDFLPTREVMLWHDDVAKRLLASLLAALRTNGVQGVHCQLSRRETSRIAFYRRYRFEPVDVEGCDLTNDVILARAI